MRKTLFSIFTLLMLTVLVTPFFASAYTYPDGTLIRLEGNFKIYTIFHNHRRWIRNIDVFNSYGYKWEDILVIPPGYAKGLPINNLIREEGDTKVYVLNDFGVKRHISNPAVFMSYGFKWQDIATVSKQEMESYPESYLVKKVGDPRVYYLEDGKKRWVDSIESFYAHGLNWDAIQVINSTDMSSYTDGETLSPASTIQLPSATIPAIPAQPATSTRPTAPSVQPIATPALGSLVPIAIAISPEVSKRLYQLGWNDDGAREVAKRARASTVCFLRTEKHDRCGGATGFVTQGGLVATCEHCTPHVHDDATGKTRDLSKFRIKTITGEILAAEILEKSDIADLALVKVTSNASALPPPLLIERYPVNGEPVIMVGHPGVTGPWTITLGKVESVDLDATGRGWTVVDISNASGNSGSPVLNKNGEVVGILSHGGSVKDVPDPYPLELTFHLTDSPPAFGRTTFGKAESTIILHDMINRHQNKWIPVSDSKTYAYLERKAPPLPKKSTQKSTAERLQELNWSEDDARALAQKVRASTICLRPPSEPDHCISSWVATPNIIATCAHCVHSHGKDGDALVARTINNAILSVERLEKSDKFDLAILKVTSNISALPPPLALGSSSVGDPVVMVGHPDLGNWVTALGQVSLVKDGMKEYEADLASFNGNSGSAVVNRNGEVIGVVTGRAPWSPDPELYPPHILLDIYKARTDFTTMENATLLRPMLEKYK